MEALTVYLEFSSAGTCQLSCTTSAEKILTVRLYIPRALAACAYAVGDMELPFLWEDRQGTFDIFSLSITPPFFLREAFKICFDNKEYFLNAAKFSEDLDISPVKDYKVPYTLANRAKIFTLYSYIPFDINPKVKTGAIYHIFCDRFSNGGKYLDAGTKYNCHPYSEPEFAEKGEAFPNDTHFGGNFIGICEKLDYLQTLGVKTLYLSPISKAHSNHKYDVGDYMTIDPTFGGEEAFKNLVRCAKEHGIDIILDMVFNHSGSDSLYFNRYGNYPSHGAYSGKDSPYYKWYTFEKFPDKYKCWWGIDILPAFDKSNVEFLNFICGDDGVIDYYMSFGIAGARLDVADELPLPFLEKIYKKIKSYGGTVYGEVWENGATKTAYGEERRYFSGGRLDAVTNYPLRSAILNYLKDADAQKLADICLEIYTDYPKEVSLNLMNIIGTHDTARTITELAGKSDSGMTMAQKSRERLSDTERKKGEALLKNALFLQAFLPGIPTIYYGDEIGMEGYGDPFNRRFMRWDMCGNAINLYCKKILRIRQQNRPLYEGGFKINYAKNGIFIFTRHIENEYVICGVNMSQKDADFFVDGQKQTLSAGQSALFGKEF